MNRLYYMECIVYRVILIVNGLYLHGVYGLLHIVSDSYSEWTVLHGVYCL